MRVEKRVEKITRQEPSEVTITLERTTGYQQWVTWTLFSGFGAGVDVVKISLAPEQASLLAKKLNEVLVEDVGDVEVVRRLTKENEELAEENVRLRNNYTAIKKLQLEDQHDAQRYREIRTFIQKGLL